MHIGVSRLFFLYQKKQNKQIQKGSDSSIQIQSNGSLTNEGDISSDKVSGDKVSGDKYSAEKSQVIIKSNPDELDIRNFSHYNNRQIETVIENGNNATIRKWCFELIINERQDHLIQKCIENMSNDREKYILLKDLSDRSFENSNYFPLIYKSLDSQKFS